MIRTGEQYRQGLRDGREVYVDGVRVDEVTAHPQFRPIVDVRARIYDLAHEEKTQDIMTYEEGGERFAVGLQLPKSRAHWEAKRNAVDLVMKDIGGVVTRVGDETIGEMWSLWDGADILNEIDSRFSENIERHIKTAIRNDPFHVSANTELLASDLPARKIDFIEGRYEVPLPRAGGKVAVKIVDMLGEETIIVR